MTPDQVTDDMLDAAVSSHSWNLVRMNGDDDLIAQMIAAAVNAMPIADIVRYVDPKDNAVTRTMPPVWWCAAGRLGHGVGHIAKCAECEHFDCSGPHRVLRVAEEVQP